MRYFSGMDYLRIDIANCYGLDKQLWQERLDFVSKHERHLADADKAESPVLYQKAVRAYRRAQRKLPVNHLVGMDATASGLQLIAVLMGCQQTASAVNLVDTGKREDIYSLVAEEMSRILGSAVARIEVKRPVMTHFYDSKAVPKAEFGKGKKLKAFYQALGSRLPGAEEFLNQTRKLWNPEAEFYRWVMPDGHVVKIPVLAVAQKRLEVDELDHMRFTYQTTVVQAQAEGRSLPANIVHSVDAYVVRQMIRRAHQQGFQILPVHDCFYSHPNFVNKIRQNYVDILAELASTNLLQQIVDQINPSTRIVINKGSDIASDILNSEYALS